MGQIEDLRAFVQIVEHESIGKAAEAVGIAKSAMSRRLRLLEERMQTELIVRTTRQWALTEAGRQYYERGLDIILAFDEIEAQVRNESRVLRGEIRLSVPLYFGKAVLSAHLLEFAKLHPELHLKVNFSDRVVDVIGENYDLVVRISDLPESSLIAQKLCETRHVFCASTDYLADHPVIETPADLRAHRVIQFGHARRFKWSAKTSGGKDILVPLTSVINSDDGAFLIDAAVQGLGITRVPDFMVQAALETGRLIHILDQYEPKPRGIFIVYPATRYLPARTRALLEFLLARVSSD